MDDDRPVDAKAAVASGQPEQDPRRGEEEGERGGGDRIQLLTGVETALRRLPQREPAAVIAVEPLDLAPVGGERAAVADDDDEHDRHAPGDCGEQVHVLDQPPVRDGGGEVGNPEDEAGREQDEERRRARPVERPLSTAETADVLRRARRRGHSSGRSARGVVPVCLPEARHEVRRTSIRVTHLTLM